MRAHQVPRGSMGAHENPWGLIKFNEKVSHDTAIPHETRENPWESLGTHGNPSEPMGIYRNP